MACKHEGCNAHHKKENEELHQAEKIEELEEQEEQEEKSRIGIIFYIVSVAVFILTFIPVIPQSIKIGMYFATLLLAGYELFLEGIKNIFHLKFEEDTLMTIAAVAACCLGEFREACLVILLFCLGEFIEDIAVSKSNQHIEKIVDMKADTANRLKNSDKTKDTGDNIEENNQTILGDIEVVSVEELKIGDKILIKPGEMVPVDCKILSGNSMLDTSRITGESEPKAIESGQEILSGNINLSGSLTAEVMKEYKDSTASQIIDLVYEATNNKGKTEKFITKFSKIYTPIIMVLALAIAIIPILFGMDAKTWITRSLVFLVASCPCSIVISIPLAFFSCVGVLSKKGLLVKGTKHIENLAKAKTVCFDKTGTITTGKMVIEDVKLYDIKYKDSIDCGADTSDNIETANNLNKAERKEVNMSEEQKQFFSYIYSLEHLSNHPIATSIENEIKNQGWNKEELLQEVSEQEEIPGYGMKGVISNQQVLFGNKKLLDKYQISYSKDLDGNGVYLAVDGKLKGYIVLKEEIRKGLEGLKQKLRKLGIHKVAMLTGDEQKKAEKIAEKVGDIEVYAGLLPKDKLEKVEEFKEKGKVVFVGDGINDSPVLASADFSISMGEGTRHCKQYSR